MSKYSTITVLHQLQNLLPLNDFERFVGQHKADRYSKKLKCRNQLSIMLYAQATEKDSLREIETGLKMWDSTWYHLGIKTVARNTLAKANEKRPYKIYESLFYKVLEQCQNLTFGTASFSFKNDLYAIDSTTIDLCLNLFPWARFRKEKGAIKLHTLFNIRSQIPELIQITDGKGTDIVTANDIDLTKYPKGSIFVIDKAYTDYSFFWKIKKAGHYFVIRMKDNANTVHLLGQDRKAIGDGVIKDEKLAFALPTSQEDYPEDLRLVTYYDTEHDVLYEFLTNNFKLSALNIALIYKRRWDIELFFKWIKQHLKIKTFLGTSKNAVLTQIWIAMIYFLLVSWIKFQTKFSGSLLELTRMIKEVLMNRVPLINILNLSLKSVSRAINIAAPPQLSLF